MAYSKKIGLLLCSLLFFTQKISTSFPTLAKNDPFPLFSSLDPDELLNTAERLCYRNIEWACNRCDYFSISFSGFIQNAHRGKSIRGENTFVRKENAADGTVSVTGPFITQLGDLTGRTGMIAILYGELPATVTPEDYETKLESLFKARSVLFPGSSTEPPIYPPFPEDIDNGAYIDPAQMFGYFSFPLKYRKRGFAFDIKGRIPDTDFGGTIKGRFSHMEQIVQLFNNETPATNPLPGNPDSLSPDNVNAFLMNQFKEIMEELGYDICNFVASSFEELRITAFWRHAFLVNECPSPLWPDLYLIPFVEVMGTFSPGKARDYTKFFSVPFGNNTHSGVGVRGGVNLDFVQTVSVGFEGGVVKFFGKNFDNYPLPNSEFQTTLFPFRTSVHVQPGLSTYFSAQMEALHFIGYLSAYVQYVILEHKKDKITPQKPDPAWEPKVLECVTPFRVKLFNVGFNYDLAPWLSVGIAVQLPWAEVNAYHQTTTIFSITMVF